MLYYCCHWIDRPLNVIVPFFSYINQGDHVLGIILSIEYIAKGDCSLEVASYLFTIYHSKGVDLLLSIFMLFREFGS